MNNDVRNEIRILAKLIVDRCKPKKIILFGSAARGESRPNSDIDLLIIRNTDKKRPFRVKEIFEALRGQKRNFPLDPIVYTPEEIEKRLSMGDYFIKRVLSEGKTLYG